MPRFPLLLPFAAACVLLAACDPSATISPQRSELGNAPSAVQVDGYELALEAHLWRDFQPVAPPDGQPLVAVVRVKTVDGRPFPASVTVGQIAVVYGEQVWTAPARQEHPGSQAHVLEVVARDGPKWGPHVDVDVVVRLRGSGGREFLLRAAGQRIGRTD